MPNALQYATPRISHQNAQSEYKNPLPPKRQRWLITSAASIRVALPIGNAPRNKLSPGSCSMLAKSFAAKISKITAPQD